MPETFSRQLLQWYKNNQRTLPWKEGTPNPYKIWISEIILQQTRLAQGLPYYNKFVQTFPDVYALARAKEDQVLKMWEGLGYYSRARNLHFTAKLIVKDHNGVFPNTYDEILKLKGIGPYTAAAIASFAFGLNYPVVDGNVLRLISRYFGIETSIDKTPTQKEIKRLCEQAIVKRDPSIFNQAIMDFGATVCTPKKASCEECIMNASCFAYSKNRVYELPLRSKKIKKKIRYLVFYLVTKGDKILILRREADDIWKGLYQFPLLEYTNQADYDSDEHKLPPNINGTVLHSSKTIKHILTHQTIMVKFIHVSGDQKGIDHLAVARGKLQDYAFPRVIQKYLEALN